MEESLARAGERLSHVGDPAAFRKSHEAPGLFRLIRLPAVTIGADPADYACPT